MSTQSELFNNANLFLQDSNIDIKIDNSIHINLSPTVETLETSKNNNLNIHQVMNASDIIFSNCDKECIEKLSTKTIIFWPIKVQKHITLIHFAQIKLLKFLQKNYHVKIDIIISGTFDENKEDERKRTTFTKRLKKILDKHNCEYDLKDAIRFLNSTEVQKIYVDLLQNFTVSDIIEFKTKKYEKKETKLNKLKEEKIIDVTDFLFNYSVICHNHNLLGNTIDKSMILAGADEYDSWSELLTHYYTDDEYHMGGIFIPRLIIKQGYDFDQSSIRKELTEQRLDELAKIPSVKKWLFQLFLLLPWFSSNTVPEEIFKIRKFSIPFDENEFSKTFLKAIDKKEFIKYLYESTRL